MSFKFLKKNTRIGKYNVYLSPGIYVRDEILVVPPTNNNSFYIQFDEDEPVLINPNVNNNVDIHITSNGSLAFNDGSNKSFKMFLKSNDDATI